MSIFVLFWGHSWQLSRVTFGSGLRDYSQWCSGDPMGHQGLNIDRPHARQRLSPLNYHSGLLPTPRVLDGCRGLGRAWKGHGGAQGSPLRHLGFWGFWQSLNNKLSFRVNLGGKWVALGSFVQEASGWEPYPRHRRADMTPLLQPPKEKAVPGRRAEPGEGTGTKLQGKVHGPPGTGAYGRTRTSLGRDRGWGEPCFILRSPVHSIDQHSAPVTSYSF